MLHLLYTSPDNRYWILRERSWYPPRHGDTYLYDRRTGWTTVLLWGDQRRPYDFAAWLSNSSLIVNEGDYLMHFDTESYERRYALAERTTETLPDPSAYCVAQVPTCPRDGQ